MRATTTISHHLALCLLAICPLLISQALALRISSIEVPAAAMNSSQVVLICNYELQGDQLYSVKWYKDYVEFYRFQPPTSDSASPAATPTPSSTSDEDTTANSKHDFELDGINLDLSRSNASHVHLRQVSLASEGTYKCEVTADTSTFPTVKSERQMKVYVLPKQKLTIVANSPSLQVPGSSGKSGLSASSAAASQQDQHHQAVTIEHQHLHTTTTTTMKAPLIYNVNDILNLTCVSGPSKPAAKLSWLLNDTPVAPTSKWLVQHHNQAASDPRLVASRLTLAFKIQPNQLQQQRIVTPTQVQSQHEQSGNLIVMRIQCVARLTFEYSSESSILVSGGKTTIKKRQQQPQIPGPLSLASSLQSVQLADEVAAIARQISATNSTEPSIYRWPRPPSNGASLQRQPSAAGWRRQGNPHSFMDAWITSPASTESSPTSDAIGEPHHIDDQPPDPPVARRHGPTLHTSLVIWTDRQLRAQAEHINSMLSILRPNELEPPMIEGKLWQVDEGIEEAPPTSLSNDDTALPIGADSDGASVSSRDDSVVEPSSSIKDYELNDLVRFNCQPRLGGAASEVYSAGKNVRSKWIINGKEIFTNQVNAFDGSKFYYTRDPEDNRWAHQPSITASNRSSSLNMQAFSPSNTNNLATGDTQLANPTETNTNYKPATNQSEESVLWVEFTPSLFQLKELNLKCHTMLEQVLVEYDSQLVVSVPTSQIDQPKYKARSQSQKNGGRVYLNTGNKHHEKNRLGAPRTTQSGSMTIVPDVLLLFVGYSLAQLFLTSTWHCYSGHESLQ